MTVWDTLGLAPGADRDAIRRAYAKKLRVTNPEDDAEGFKVLRAAYEMALAHADNAAAWADDAPDDEAEATFAAAEIARPDAGLHFRTEPAAETPPPDVADLLAARETDIEQLNALLGTLDAALRGPWRSDERTVAETFAAVLRSPAMGEIRVAADVEQWVAGLLAATIPRSDVILAEAIAAFGWSDERYGNRNPAVGAVLARLDEWRIIEGLNRDGHPLHPAWKSLTWPAGAYWSWRLDAFRPGMESGVATLLGGRGAVSPGLEYSFKADSVARWRRFLDVPHWTLGMLTAIPLTLLLWLFATDAFGDPVAAIAPWANYAIGAAVLLSPGVPFLARVLRGRWLRAPHPAWLDQSWVAALAVVFLGAMALPTTLSALAALFVASAGAWLWMAVAGGPATIEEVRARVRASWLTAIGCALLGIGAALSLDSIHRAALALMLMLGATVMFGPLTHGARPLARVRWWRAAYAVAVVAGIAGVAFGAALLLVRPMTAALFYAGGLTLVSGMIVAGAARIAGVHGSGEQRTLRFLKAALVGVFLFGAFAAIGDLHPERTERQQGSAAVPLASDDDPLRNRILAALGASADAQGALGRLRVAVPGFGQIARDNPELEDKIEQVVARDFVNLRTDAVTADTLIDLVGEAYGQRLQRAAESQLLEEIEIRRLRLRALREQSVDLCIAPRNAVDEATLPGALRDRQTAQTFNIASNPLATDEELAGETPYPPAAFDAMLERASGQKPAAVIRALRGTAGKAAQCDAAIAMATALAQASDRSRAAATARIVLFGANLRKPTPPAPEPEARDAHSLARPAKLISF